jgi:hypothetical protein
MGVDGMHDLDRALVLGPGGRLGTAWTAGLAAGLRSFGVDLGDADLIVGTSAGAIVGAVIATGQDPARLATVRRSANASSAPRLPDPAVTGAVFAVLGDPDLATSTLQTVSRDSPALGRNETWKRSATPARLGENCGHQLLLAAEVVEQHPRAGPPQPHRHRLNR